MAGGQTQPLKGIAIQTTPAQQQGFATVPGNFVLLFMKIEDGAGENLNIINKSLLQVHPTETLINMLVSHLILVIKLWLIGVVHKCPIKQKSINMALVIILSLKLENVILIFHSHGVCEEVSND